MISGRVASEPAAASEAAESSSVMTIIGKSPIPVPPNSSRDRGTEEALCAEGLEQLVGDEQIATVDLLRDRLDLVSRELASHVAGERRHLILKVTVVDSERSDHAGAEGTDPRLIRPGADEPLDLRCIEPGEVTLPEPKSSQALSSWERSSRATSAA